MTYYIAGLPYSAELYHHGVKGQKWGVRRYQNPDGSLTEAGKRKYGTVENFQNAQRLKSARREYKNDSITAKRRVSNPLRNITKNQRQKTDDAFANLRNSSRYFKDSIKAYRVSSKEASIKRGEKLSRSGYNKTFNIGSAVIHSMMNSIGTKIISDALKSTNSNAGNVGAAIVDAMGIVNQVAIIGKTTRNIYDYNNYNNRSKR